MRKTVFRASPPIYFRIITSALFSRGRNYVCQPTFQYRSNQSDNRKVLLLPDISSLLRERKLLPGHKKILFLTSLIQETQTQSPVVSALGLVVCLIPRPSAVGTISLQTYPGAFTHTSYSEEMKKE